MHTSDHGVDKLKLSFVVPGRLAGMSWPEFAEPISAAVDFLKSNHVHTLVNLTSADYESSLFREEFRIVHIPLANMTAPTREQMDDVLTAYRELPDNAALSAHCMHGLGRTGTILACIIGREFAIRPSIAMMAVRAKRPGSIESEEQERFVFDYLGSS